jgi:hypothetical protein
MADNLPRPKISLVFFRAESGIEPIREWLKKMPEAERHAIGKESFPGTMAGPVGMPLCRPLGGGLWQVRTDLATKRIAGVLLCLHCGHSCGDTWIY